MRLCIDYRLPQRQPATRVAPSGEGPNLPADRQESAPPFVPADRPEQTLRADRHEAFTPRGFVAHSQWRPATSPAYQAIPHEYTVKAKAAFDPWFDLMVIHIRRHGRKRRWGKRTFIYLGLDGWRYWTMEATPSETTLINRARNRR